MPIQDPLTQRLPTCLRINFGKAKIEVRRLGMGSSKGTGEMELEVKDIQ